MKKPFVILLGLLIAVGFAAIIKSHYAPDKQSQENDWKTLSETEYSIQYPENWELVQIKLMGAEFFLYPPFNPNQGVTRPNINLIIQDFSGQNMTLSHYVAITENEIKTKLSNSKILLSNRIRKDKVEFQKIIYTGYLYNRHLKFEVYCFIVDNKAYTLTLTTEEKEFADYQEIGEEILNTFQINK